MIRTLLTLTLAGATAFAAPAARRDLSDDAKIGRELAGRIPGIPQSCINPSPSEGSSHYGNTVLMKDRMGVIYRTHFEGGCTASDWDVLVSRRPSTQLCRGDIIEIHDQSSGFFRGACSYSDFVPYRRPPKAQSG